MKRTPLDRVRDRLLETPNEIDESHLPPKFKEARSILADAIASMEVAGISSETLVTVMLAEMLPRMVQQNGPVWAATMLAKLAQNIRAEATGSMQ
jgi:hypothetical protein